MSALSAVKEVVAAFDWHYGQQASERSITKPQDCIVSPLIHPAKHTLCMYDLGHVAYCSGLLCSMLVWRFRQSQQHLQHAVCWYGDSDRARSTLHMQHVSVEMKKRQQYIQ